jgi:hypothetical protein
MVYEMKIVVSTADNNTMKHGNVLNNLSGMIANVVTRGLTKHEKKTFNKYSEKTGECLKYKTSLIRTFTAKINILSFFFFNISCKMHISPPLDDVDLGEKERYLIIHC